MARAYQLSTFRMLVCSFRKLAKPAAPSQELAVIRRNHKTGEVSLDPLRWA